MNDGLAYGYYTVNMM